MAIERLHRWYRSDQRTRLFVVRAARLTVWLAAGLCAAACSPPRPTSSTVRATAAPASVSAGLRAATDTPSPAPRVAIDSPYANSTSCALLIGIADYHLSPGVDSLNGPLNDIDIVRTLLVERFGIPPPDIEVLRDSAATHSGIARAFERLAKRSTPCAFVYIHYSGHGSVDRKFSRPTWVTYGSRAPGVDGDDGHDVKSEEIGRWIAALPTHDIVFVSDSCHSATSSRGIRTGRRGVPADVREDPAADGTPSRTEARPYGVWIGAARDIETAMELDVRTSGSCSVDGAQKTYCHGVFTWHWVRSLQQATPGERWNDVFDRTYALVTNSANVEQLPQREGDGSQPVFGGRFPPRPPTLAVDAVDGSGATLRLRGGATAGVTRGSTFVRYRADGASGNDDALEIEDVEAFSSRARIVRGRFEVGDPVKETVHAYPTAPIRLFVGGEYADSGDSATVAAIRTRVARLAGFELTPKREEADWWVYVARPAVDTPAPARAPLPDSAPDRPAQIWVVDRQAQLMHPSMRIPMADPDQSIERLADNLSTYAWSREIRRLAQGPGVAPVALQVEVWTPDRNCTDCDGGTDGGTPGYRKRGPYDVQHVDPPPAAGDILRLRLRNLDNARAWNAYVLGIGPDAAVQALHPTLRENLEAAELPPAGEVLARGGYRLADSGTETLVLLVSRDPVPIASLTRPGMAGGSKGNSALERLLQAAGTRAPGARGEVGQWAAVQVEFRIGP